MDNMYDGIILSKAGVSAEGCTVKFGWIFRDPEGSSLEDFSDEQLGNLSKAFTTIAKKAIACGAQSVEFYPDGFDMLEVNFNDYEKFIEFLNTFPF